MESSKDTVLIIGAGVFGTSTAYHLSTRIPPEKITIVDQHPLPTPGAASEDPPLGASHDINKIVRSDYSLPFYMELAEEAITAWGTWDLVKPYYHRTGWVAFGDEGSDRVHQIRWNFCHRPEREDPTKDMSFDEVKSSWNGVLKDVSLTGMENAYYNPTAGWVEADKAVAAMLDAAVQRGVKYHQGKAKELVLGEKGVQGIKMAGGDTIQADKVLLATGAWTPEMMASVEEQLGLMENERLEAQAKAAGVCCAHFVLSEEEKETFDQVPVFVYGERGV